MSSTWRKTLEAAAHQGRDAWRSLGLGSLVVGILLCSCDTRHYEPVEPDAPNTGGQGSQEDPQDEDEDGGDGSNSPDDSNDGSPDDSPDGSVSDSPQEGSEASKASFAGSSKDLVKGERAWRRATRNEKVQDEHARVQ